MQKFTKSKLLGAFVVAGTLFGSGVFAASIFSANAEPWFASKCVAGARGPVAAVCDLHERVVALENAPDVTVPKQLIVRDADGGYVGELAGLVYQQESSGTAYNSDHDVFIAYSNGRIWGSKIVYAFFQSSNCSGQAFASDVSSRSLLRSGSDTDSFSFWTYSGDMLDSQTIQPLSYYHQGQAGCQLGDAGLGSGNYYPIQEADWVYLFNEPIVVELE